MNRTPAVTVPIANSGGPLLDQFGNVIGVVVIQLASLCGNDGFELGRVVNRCGDRLDFVDLFRQAELVKLIRRLGDGDVLMVTRLDRLARSTRDLLNILDTIAKAGAGFKSLTDAWADATTAHGRLMLTVLGGLAEFERELLPAQMTAGSAPWPAGCRSRADVRCEPSHDIEAEPTPFEDARSVAIA